MNFKKIFSQLNIFTQCRRYGLSLWQCPQFLFPVMGIIIILTMIVSYQVGTYYVEEPEMITSIVVGVTVVLLVIGFFVIQSFERLAEAARAKSEFVSIVSHQLRSPLSNLKWAIELLMSGRSDSVTEKQLEYFKVLKENSDRMLELVSDLLTVSRIETAKLSLRKEKVSLVEPIKELIKEFKPFAEASNVEIEFKAQEKLPEVLIDLSQVKLVIENFLDNAIRYIKERGKIAIKLEKRDKNIYFEIKDNGVGIPKEDQKYISQKFFRSRNVLRHQTQGSGLGLYIAKSIIDKSKGKMGFKSQEGAGSTFWFTLPIKS